MDRSDITRARARLWGMTFIVLGALVALVIYLASGPVDVALPDFLPSRGLLGLGIVGTALAFGLYVIDAERKFANLTERVFAERAERMLLAEHEADQRDFISLTAHELRTPLTVIKGYVATLASREDSIAADRRARYLAIVNDQTDRLAALVDGLMEISRIESGKLALAPEDIDLAQLLRSLTEVNAKRWQDRVQVEIVSPTTISGDLRRIEAIVTNLVDNAVKYSDDDVVIRLDALAGGGTEIAVADHGGGISPDQIGELFQKFHRLPQAIEADVPGTGLGLYIVRALAKAHGGDVDVSSVPGEGSTFTVRLPAARELSVTA